MDCQFVCERSCRGRTDEQGARTQGVEAIRRCRDQARLNEAGAESVDAKDSKRIIATGDLRVDFDHRARNGHTGHPCNPRVERLIESAARLCNADMGAIVRPQASHVQFLATYGFSQDFIDVASSTPIAPGRWTLSGRVMVEGRTVHIPDVLADNEYTFSAAQKIAGFRSGLGVPLVREGTPIGVINLAKHI